MAGGGAVWSPRTAVGTPADALRAVALAAEDLLTSDLVGYVAACPGVGCGWLFADRRRRRRWCSMAACGNRAKARRYAERHGVRP
jgi:predicted RNA-binding Zn ribbon-like protein